MRKILFLMSVMFLIVLPMAFSLTQDEIATMTNSLIWSNDYEINISHDRIFNNQGVNTSWGTAPFYVYLNLTDCVLGQCAYFTEEGLVNYTSNEKYHAIVNQTVSCWVNTVDYDVLPVNQDAFISKMYKSEVDGIWRMFGDKTDDSEFKVQSKNPTGSVASKSISKFDGTWTMLTGVWNRTDGVIYACVNDSSNCAEGISVNQDINNTYSLILGSQAENDVYNFEGLLDECEWYNRSLTLDEIKYKYDENEAGRHIGNYINWHIPTTTSAYFTNNSITVSLNIISYHRNETRFRLYNSSKDLVDSFNISNDDTGSYLYNATFSDLTDSTYYINATHHDIEGYVFNSTTLTFSNSYLNITFYDEFLDTIITGDEITLEAVGNNFAQNYSTITGKIGVVGWTIDDYRLTYDSDNFGKRSYYYTLGNATNYSISLYLLTTTNGTDVTFTVQDNSGNELENATIWLKKYFVSSNSYRTVAMERTNEEGEASIDVDFNDPYYQILVTYKTYSLQTIGAKIISTTRILTLDLIPDPFTSIDIMENMVTSLTFNNLTQTFSYSFTDTTGASRSGLLEVWRITPKENTLSCSNTDISSSATLLCTVNTTNVTGTYSAMGYIQVGSRDMNVLTDTYNVFTGITSELKQMWSTQGIFFSIFVAGSLGTLGLVASPAVGIIMFLAGLVITFLFGMSTLTFSVIGLFIIIGVVIIYRMKR